MLIRDYRDVPAQEIPGLPGVTVRWAISTPEGAPNFAMRIFEVQPGYASPLHSHDWEHEIFVLAGSGVANNGHEETPIAAGSTIFVPPNATHQFRNTGESVLRFLCMIPTVPEALPPSHR